MNDKQRTTVILDPDTHKKLRILALTRGVSMKRVIEQVLEDYLKVNRE